MAPREDRSKLVTLPGAPPPPRRPRDLRIDMFRGLALAMIFIDHVPGNPYERFTSRNFGFSDAAEAFFVMSGIAAGLAYSGRFLPEQVRRQGLWQAVAPIWARAWLLYLVQIMMTCVCIGLFAAAMLYFDAPELMQRNNLRQVFQNPGEALLGIPFLLHQIGYVNILPVYAVLLFAAPAIIPLAERWPWAVAVGSLGLWFCAGVFRWNLPNFPNPGGWFFNPFTWQAVFVTGLLIGIALRRGERFVPRIGWLFWLAAGFLVFVLAWRFVPGLGPFLNHQMAWLGAQGVPFNIVSHDKTFLALPRFLHVLALVYVISCLGWVVTLAESRWVAPLRLLGRHGLLVFAWGTIIAMGFQTLMFTHEGSVWMPLVLPPLGLAIQLGLAWLKQLSADDARRRARAAASRPGARPVAEPQARGLAG